MDPSPLPLRGFAVPVAAAEDLVSESPEVGGPLYSSRKPHNWVVRCRENSSRIRTIETGSVSRSPTTVPALRDPHTSPNRDSRAFLFSSQSSCHSQWSDCSPLLRVDLSLELGELPHTETHIWVEDYATVGSRLASHCFLSTTQFLASYR